MSKPANTPAPVRSISHGRRQLFAYYRVAPADVERVQAEVADLQVGLERELPGLQARLLVRESVQTHVTLMEIYSFDAAARPEGIDAALQQHLESLLNERVGSRAAGGRQVEVFLECAW